MPRPAGIGLPALFGHPDLVDTRDRPGLEAAEDRLQDAVRSNSADQLAAVLHDELVAVAPDGRLVGKQEDVAGYASGAFRVERYEQLERQVAVVGSTGVTFVVADVTGWSAGTHFGVVMRYTRTWVHEGTWRVLAAHLSLLSG